MTTPNLGLALAAAPDTIAQALITKFNGNFSTLDTLIGNKVDKGSPITNLITTTAVAGGVPLVAKGILLQSGNLFEARDNVDAVKANINAAGQIFSNGVLLGAGAVSPTTLTANNASERPLLLKGFASQSANLLETQDSSSNILTIIRYDGLLVGPGGVSSGSYLFNIAGAGYGAIFQGHASNSRGLAIKAHASQSANIFEVINSSGTVRMFIDPNGAIVLGDGTTTQVKLDAANYGVAPNETFLTLRYSNSSIVQTNRVTVGAASSGGAGFRVLCVPN